MNAPTLHAVRPLPAQPLVATGVLRELARDAVPELTALVEIDPSLTVAVVQAANSPHLRQSRRVASVRQAMVLLGTTAVEAIATSRTAALVLAPDDPGFPPGFWVRSVAAAASARVVADRLGLNADEAFTAAMIHDIGDLILFRRDPELHGVVAARMAKGGRALLEQESGVLGRAHTDVGGDQLDRWFFPPRMVTAIKRHHAPIEAVADGLEKAVWGGVRLGSIVVSQPFHPNSPEPSSALAVLKALKITESPDKVLHDIDRRVEAIVKVAGGDR